MPFVQRWIELFPDNDWLISVIQDGLRISFNAHPPLTDSPQWIKIPNNPLKAKALRAEVLALKQKDAIEIIQEINTPAFYSHLFVVPKPGNRWRPVIDLSILNTFINAPHFKMETAKAVRNSVRPNEYAVSLDLTDAYLHIPIHKSTRKYLRFAIDGVVYAFKALPFGLNLSPWVFTRIMESVVSLVRKDSNSEISHYLDDLLQKNSNPETLKIDLQNLISKLEDLGFMINQLKSDLVPAQDFIHLGMNFITTENCVKLTEKRKDKMLLSIDTLLAQNESTARDIAAVIGQLSAAAELIPLGRLFLRPVQIAFRESWSQTSQDWDQILTISKDLRKALEVWMNPEWLMKGIPLIQPLHTMILFTDSSLQGWGAHLMDQSFSGESREISGIWALQEKMEYRHINELEMLAIYKAVTLLQSHLKDKGVLLMTDNTTAMGYLKNEGGTFSKTLCYLATIILQFCSAMNITLTIRHIPSRLNVLADGLSRQNLSNEWRLNREIFLRILHLYPSMEIDLFANRWNKQLPMFVSPFPDPLAKGVDGLSIDWTNLDLYAFPPFPLIAKIIQRLHRFQCRMTLIAPLRWNRSWISPLLTLCEEIPRKLPVQENLLFQGENVFHPDLDSINLHVFRLCGGLCKKDNLDVKLRKELFSQGGLPL